jgi:hypothetical protein
MNPDGKQVYFLSKPMQQVPLCLVVLHFLLSVWLNMANAAILPHCGAR